MTQYAVIRTGGKQYLVEPGKTYRFEKLAGDVGTTVDFGQPLLAFDADGANIRVGSPTVEGTTVRGTILRQARTRKLRVIKYRAKSRYRRTIGHRQHITDVRIDAIA